jgi:nucleoside-diphosphate-sugar epimerase
MTKVYTKSALAAKYLKATETSLKLTPTPEQLKLYGVDVEYLIDKAKNELGYAPQVSAARGLELSVSWLRHHGLLF